MNHHTASCRLSYAKKFARVLLEGDATEILTLSVDKRIHVMKALASLSKYLGCYNKWNQIRQQYQLKWSNGDDFNTFTTILNIKTNYSNMVAWLKNAYYLLPKEYGNILIYCTLTGLRSEEAIHSLKIVRNDIDKYLNKETMMLEHFKFPTFIRKTKKAYISIVTDEILRIARSCGTYSYNSIRMMARRNGMDMKMSYCRKIFATNLRMSGIEQELIDLLQGRVPKSVFARHYFRPDINDDRLRTAVNHLSSSILS